MKLSTLLLAPLSFICSGHAAESLTYGAPAPSLTVITGDGTELETGKAFASGTVLVFFYPKADTPGCTKQACSLRDGWKELQDKGVSVYGVSMDKPAAQKAFADKYKLPFPLIADADLALHKAFQTPARSRRAYLFKDGSLVWFDLKASTSKQAEDVLQALAGIEKG